MTLHFVNRRVALLIVAIVIAGCTSTLPQPSSSPSPTMAPSAAASDPTVVPGGPSPVPGRVACPDIASCLAVSKALSRVAPDAPADNETLVFAPNCGPGTSCQPGVHIVAVLVPNSWRLGDDFRAWLVDGPEDALVVTDWPLDSLPERVLTVVRSYVHTP